MASFDNKTNAGLDLGDFFLNYENRFGGKVYITSYSTTAVQLNFFLISVNYFGQRYF